jgi:acyl carrier protein
MSFEKIFADVFTIPLSSVFDGLALEDIPTWDSMSHMHIIVQLEESYQVQFTGDEIANIRTIADARSALIALGVKL